MSRRLRQRQSTPCSARSTGRRRASYRRCAGTSPRSAPGFTIVEIMCAMTLLIVGTFSVFTLIIQSIESNMESSHYSIARAVAQRQMEEFRTKVWASMPTANNADPANPTPAATIAGISSLLPGGVGTDMVTQENSSSQTGLDLITVTITWTEPGRGTDSLILDTYVTEDGINSH